MDNLNNNGSQSDHDDQAVSDELEAMKRRVLEMEQETAQLRELHTTVEKDINLTPVDPAKAESDARSVYVGNVDYAVTPEQLQQHFQSCGDINRITIVCDKYTGHPKGFAYVEFADTNSIQAANDLTDSELNGRPLKVIPKRTNLPGLSQNARGRGRGRGRGGNFSHGARGGYGSRGGFRGRGGSSRGRGGYAPY